MYGKIKKLCEINNISGNELGKLLNLKKSPLTDWKNGKAKPTVDQIIKMCEIFEVTADYILGLKNVQNLSENEQELLENFKHLPEREQIKLIGKIEETANSYKNEKMEKSSISKTG